MARPIKKGLDYFPLDVNFFSNKKIKVLKSRFGADGVVIYLYILCEAYKENGYYAKNDDDFVDVVADDLNMSGEKVGQVINFLCGRSLLDSKLFVSDKVLTSHGIQTRFQSAIKSRAAKVATEVKEKYWVLSKNETLPYVKVTQNPNYSENNPSYSEKNPNYSEKNSIKESKEKESKINKSKVKEKKEKEKGEAPPSAAVLHAYEKYIGIVTPLVADDIDDFLSKGVEPELIIRIIEYACEQNARSRRYIQQAIINNLNDGILTLDAYNRKEADRRVNYKPPQKKSKFNNYTSESKTDYAELEEQILDSMLDGDYEREEQTDE